MPEYEKIYVSNPHDVNLALELTKHLPKREIVIDEGVFVLDKPFCWKSTENTIIRGASKNDRI